MKLITTDSGPPVQKCLNAKEQLLISAGMIVFSLLYIVFAFAVDSPANILRGMAVIIKSPCSLITDYIALAGIGAAFFNAGLVMLISAVLVAIFKVPYSGNTIAAVNIMGGFALFGKNVVNIWPIFIGIYIYSLLKKEEVQHFFHVGLYATTLAPLVSEMCEIFKDHPAHVRLGSALAAGVAVGVLIVPIARWTSRCSQGYNLYNTGFAAGLVGMVAVSLMQSFGYTPARRLYWSEEYTGLLAGVLFAIFLFNIVLGLIMLRGDIKKIVGISFHSGHSADFLKEYGLGACLFNMGMVGALMTACILMVGGDLNGPTAGCIITVAGFACCGLNPRNVAYIQASVMLSSQLKVWQLTEPGVQLSMILCTGLAPLAGEFGLVAGLVTGFLFSSVVRSVGVLHGALNLYNNGFAAGFMSIILVPVFREVQHRFFPHKPPAK